MSSHMRSQVGSRIIDNRSLEIENAFGFPARDGQQWMRRANKAGFTFRCNTAHSAYIDTVDLDLLRNGITMRLRRGGTQKTIANRHGQAVEGQSFPNQFALKRRNSEFQRVADEISRDVRPSYADAGIFPYIRDEIEGEHDYPATGSEVRFGDLPTQKWRSSEFSVAQLVENLILQGKMGDIKDTGNLVLMPRVTTTVKRYVTDVYIDAHAGVDFFHNWPSPQPTQTMLRHGAYLCVEVAVDECTQRLPPVASIASVVQATEDDFRKFRKLGRMGLFEYETSHHHNGPQLTDVMAVETYIRFGMALLDYARESRGADLKPERSKATNAYGSIPECRAGGRLHDLYRRALTVAP